MHPRKITHVRVLIIQKKFNLKKIFKWNELYFYVGICRDFKYLINNQQEPAALYIDFIF